MDKKREQGITDSLVISDIEVTVFTIKLRLTDPIIRHPFSSPSTETSTRTDDTLVDEVSVSEKRGGVAWRGREEMEEG
jgi:hypothetical protein